MAVENISTNVAANSSASGKLVLAKFKWDHGRQGVVEGLFIVNEGTLKAAYGKFVTFGEILGKHSDVCDHLGEADIKILTDDQDFLAQMLLHTGPDVSGYNPLNYIRSDEDD